MLGGIDLSCCACSQPTNIGLLGMLKPATLKARKLFAVTPPSPTSCGTRQNMGCSPTLSRTNLCGLVNIMFWTTVLSLAQRLEVSWDSCCRQVPGPYSRQQQEAAPTLAHAHNRFKQQTTISLYSNLLRTTCSRARTLRVPLQISPFSLTRLRVDPESSDLSNILRCGFWCCGAFKAQNANSEHNNLRQ